MEDENAEEDLLTRALRLIDAFQTRGHLATREVQSILNLDRQKARRTIKRLQASGLPISPSGQGNSTEWILDAGFRQNRLRLGFGDMLALELGQQLLGFLEGTDIGTWHHELRERVLPALGIRDRARLSSLSQKVYYHTEPYRRFAAQDETINVLVTALFSDQELSLRYGDDEPSTIARFQPLTLVIYRRALYLLGLEVNEEGPQERLLAVDRIQEAQRGEPFLYPEDHHPDAVLGARFGIWKEEQIEPVLLRFSADRAHLVRSRHWHASQKIVDLPDGRVELQMLTGGRELVRFCLEWGPKVEVVQPPWLRKAVIDELTAALQQYQLSPVPKGGEGSDAESAPAPAP